MANDEVERIKEKLERAEKRIAELEARLVIEIQARSAPLWLYSTLDTAEVGVWQWDVTLDKVSWSDTIYKMHGLTRETFGGDLASVMQAIVEEDRPVLEVPVQRALVTGQPYTVEYRICRTDGAIRWVQGRGQAELDEKGRAFRLAGVLQDITERKNALDERLVMQQKIIDAQRETLREIGAPIIPLADHTLAVPLVGQLTRERADQVNEALLHAVRESSAQVVLLDITGVPTLDTDVAQALVRAAQAVRLLGAQVVLTGVRPQVAQILVDLGIDMQNFVMKANLKSGLEYTQRTRGKPRSRRSSVSSTS